MPPVVLFKFPYVSLHDPFHLFSTPFLIYQQLDMGRENKKTLKAIFRVLLNSLATQPPDFTVGAVALRPSITASLPFQ